MRRVVLSVLGTLLLAGLVLAAPQAPKKEGTIRCTLTDKKVEKCCCEQRKGKSYCPLAKKTVEECCCEPAQQVPKPKKS